MTLQTWRPFAELRRFNDFNDRRWFPLSPSRFAINAASEVGRKGWDIPLDVVEKDGDLTIRAETKEETANAESEYLRRERRTGSFFRAVQLPDTVDQAKVESEYANGVLTITLPKSETSKARDIAVKVA